MGITIDDVKHCLLSMIDCELCEECNLYGTTGTDHCEHDCVDGALHIINKYQKIQEIVVKWEKEMHSGISCSFDRMEDIKEVIEDGNNT